MDFYVITFFVTHTSTYSICEFSFYNRRLKYSQNLQFFLSFFILFYFIYFFIKLYLDFTKYSFVFFILEDHNIALYCASIYIPATTQELCIGIQNFIFLLFSSFDFVSFSECSSPISFVSSELKTSESRIQRMRPRNLTKHKRKPLRMEIESGGRGVRVSISSKDSKNSILERKDESTAGLLGQKIVAA